MKETTAKKQTRLTKKFWGGYFCAFFSLKQNVEAKIKEFQKIIKTKNKNDSSV